MLPEPTESAAEEPPDCVTMATASQPLRARKRDSKTLIVGSSAHGAPTHQEDRQLAGDITRELHAHDMSTVEPVDPETLLSSFFKRVAKDDNSKGADIQERVIKAIEDSGTVVQLEKALTEYRETGGKEEDLYKPAVMLLNKILDVLQEPLLKGKLDSDLKENQTLRIQFIRHDALQMRYDWHSGQEMQVVYAKPDILIVMKDAIQDYANDQAAARKAQTGEECSFDPSSCPDSKAKSRIMFKNVLGCVEMKRTTGNANRAGRDWTPSQSSQLGISLASGGGRDDNMPSQSSQLSVPESSRASRKRSRSGSSQSASSRKLQKANEGDKAKGKKSTAHLLQLGNYAAEFLSRGPYVTHNIGIKINYDKVQICWFDRQNSIVADQFDIFEDFALFVALIASLSRFSLEDWGIERRFYPGNDQLLKVPLKGGGRLEVNISQKPLCHRITLHGRGTMVLRGHFQAANTTSCVPVAVKISYPESSRVPEQVFISEGRNLHPGRNDGQQLYPKIYDFFDREWTTGDIRERLYLGSKGQSRTRRIIVFELLDNITALSASMDVLAVWTHCVAAHRDMWNKKCEHGDISIYNLMFRKAVYKGKEHVFGVLNDWDLATHRGPGHGEVYGGGAQRTGTIPFVALDLLNDKVEVTYRLYRHDLESAGWCLVYICLDCPDNAAVLREWHHRKTTVTSRKAFLMEMEEYTPREGFGSLYGFAQKLLRFLVYKAAGKPWPTPSQTSDLTPVSFDEIFLFSKATSKIVDRKEEQRGPEMSNEKIWNFTFNLYGEYFTHS